MVFFVEKEIKVIGEMIVNMVDGFCVFGVSVDNGVQNRFVNVNVDVVFGKLLYGIVYLEVFSG